MEAKEMRMSCKVMAALVAVAGLALSASAEEKTFPSAGGDLASDAAWGGTKPGNSDIAIVEKTGNYTLSSDVTFGGLRVTAGSSTFDFGNRKMTATSSSENIGGIRVTAANATNVFNGGTFDLSGTANCMPAYNMTASSVKIANTIFTNGCIVTNVNTFYGARYARNAKTEIAGGAKVYASEVRALGNSGLDNTLEIHSGGQLTTSTRTYFDAGASDSEKDGYAGQKFVVRGSGSAFNQLNSSYQVQLGFQRHSNIFRIADGGTANCNGGIAVGKKNNSILVENGATANFKNVHFNGVENTLFVSNATFTCGSGVNLAKSVGGSNNLFRVYGPDAVLFSLPAGDDAAGDFFGAVTGQCNTVVMEGGVTWGDGGHHSIMMARTHNSTFRIAGTGTTVGGANKYFYIGYRPESGKTDHQVMNSVSNRLEVLEGATLNALRIPVMGEANTLCVSNATVNIGNDSATTESVGLRIGYSWAGAPSTNCMLVIKGATPRVNVVLSHANACKFDNGSTLRFEIPKKGYAEGHVPFTVANQLSFDSDSVKLEIDCADFVACTGGRLHLIHASVIPSTTKTRLLNSCVLPAGCTLEVTSTDVYIKSRSRKGTIVGFF